MKKYDDFFLTELALKSGIEFISGKYFKDNQEIKDINRYLHKIYYTYTHKFISDRDLNYMKEGLINNPLTEKKYKWPRPKIVDEAMELYENGYRPKKCPFPLEDKQLIILMILLFHPEQEVFFITTGVGGSGKSTFLNIIIQLFDNDIAATPLGSLGETFVLADSLKHRLIASDELGAGEVALPIVKTIVSKQHMTVNEKFGAIYDVLCQSVLFYCCNKAPKLDLGDTGVLRRIIYYNRNTAIEKPDPKLKDKKWTHEDLIDFVLCAKKVEWLVKDDDINFWRFPFKDETNYYLLSVNSVGIYYKDYKKGKVYEVTYISYRDYCREYGYKAYSRQNYEEILEFIKKNYVDEEVIKNQKPFELPDFIGEDYV